MFKGFNVMVFCDEFIFCDLFRESLLKGSLGEWYIEIVRDYSNYFKVYFLVFKFVKFMEI